MWSPALVFGPAISRWHKSIFFKKCFWTGPVSCEAIKKCSSAILFYFNIKFQLSLEWQQPEYTQWGLSSHRSLPLIFKPFFFLFQIGLNEDLKKNPVFKRKANRILRFIYDIMLSEQRRISVGNPEKKGTTGLSSSHTWKHAQLGGQCFQGCIILYT